MVSCAAAGQAKARNSSAAASFLKYTWRPPLGFQLYDNRRILFFGPLPGLELGARLRARRVQAEDAAAFPDARLDPVLELGLLRRLVGDLVRDGCRDHHHALGVADHDVARVDRHAAAADRHLAVDGVVAHEI